MEGLCNESRERGWKATLHTGKVEGSAKGDREVSLFLSNEPKINIQSIETAAAKLDIRLLH